MRKGIHREKGMKRGRQAPIALCLHVESGRAPLAKACIRGYECWHCAFDQWLEEMKEFQRKKEGFGFSGGLLAKAA